MTNCDECCLNTFSHRWIETLQNRIDWQKKCWAFLWLVAKGWFVCLAICQNKTTSINSAFKRNWLWFELRFKLAFTSIFFYKTLHQMGQKTKWTNFPYPHSSEILKFAVMKVLYEIQTGKLFGIYDFFSIEIYPY